MDQYRYDTCETTVVFRLHFILHKGIQNLSWPPSKEGQCTKQVSTFGEKTVRILSCLCSVFAAGSAGFWHFPNTLINNRQQDYTSLQTTAQGSWPTETPDIAAKRRKVAPLTTLIHCIPTDPGAQSTPTSTLPMHPAIDSLVPLLLMSNMTTNFWCELGFIVTTFSCKNDQRWF